MTDYSDVQVARRGVRLVHDSGMDFSVLNILVYIVMIALVVVGVGSIFQ